MAALKPSIQAMSIALSRSGRFNVIRATPSVTSNSTRRSASATGLQCSQDPTALLVDGPLGPDRPTRSTARSGHLGAGIAAGVPEQGAVEDDRQCWATIRSGLSAGLQEPKDLDLHR